MHHWPSCNGHSSIRRVFTRISGFSVSVLFEIEPLLIRGIQVDTPRTSLPFINYLHTILGFISGNSKWPIGLMQRIVRVLWLLKSINLHKTDRVPSIPWMARPVLSSLFHVRIGRIKMRSKIIRYTVRRNGPWSLLDHRIRLVLGYTMIVAFSSMADFNVRLPAGHGNQSAVQLLMIIRDSLDCVTQFNLTSVSVIVDWTSVNNLIDTLEESPNALTNQSLIRLLSSGIQNVVSQIISSISKELNRINDESLEQAIHSKASRSSIVLRNPILPRSLQTVFIQQASPCRRWEVTFWILT